MLLSAIRAKLGSVWIGDKSKTIWVLVEGEVEGDGAALQGDGGKVLDVGTYD